MTQVKSGEEKKRWPPWQIALLIIACVLLAALLGLGIWGIVLACRSTSSGVDPEPAPGPVSPEPAPGPVSPEPVPGPTPAPEPDDPAWYLDETFCPALRKNFNEKDQRHLDRFGGWQYGFPRAFCALWDAFKTENKTTSDAAYRAWKKLFFANPPPGDDFQHGAQADLDEALPNTLYMLAVPKRLQAGGKLGKSAGFRQLEGKKRAVAFIPAEGATEAAKPEFPPNGFHADFGGSEFMNDFGTVKLAVLRGHGDKPENTAQRSWRGSQCIRQSKLDTEPGLRYVPKFDERGNLKRDFVDAQGILDESYLEVESENDTVLRAWKEEPVPGSPEQCRVDNGQGQVQVVQLTHLPKSGLLPIFVMRTGATEKIDIKVHLPLTVKVKREYFAEAVSEEHKPSKEKPWEYSLRSFACQNGNKDGGHWYAYAKVGKSWFELNNSNGVHVEEPVGDIQEVLKAEQQDIVQIFYERTA
eukprot:g7549.t1